MIYQLIREKIGNDPFSIYREYVLPDIEDVRKKFKQLLTYIILRAICHHCGSYNFEIIPHQIEHIQHCLSCGVMYYTDKKYLLRK